MGLPEDEGQRNKYENCIDIERHNLLFHRPLISSLYDTMCSGKDMSLVCSFLLYRFVSAVLKPDGQACQSKEYVSQRPDVKISLLPGSLTTKSTILAASSSIRSESISRKLTRFNITHGLSLVATVHGCGGGGGVRSLSVRIVGLDETGPRHPVEAERGKEGYYELRILSLMHASTFVLIRSQMPSNVYLLLVGEDELVTIAAVLLTLEETRSVVGADTVAIGDEENNAAGLVG